MNIDEIPFTQPAVEATRLTKIYGRGVTEVAAMRDVSLRLEPGEVLALLGPSGSGKSTLLTALGLVNPPTSGRIAIAGVVVLEGDHPSTDLAAFRRRHIGFVFQKANLIPFLSALQNVQIALEINDVPPRRARLRAMELLDYLGAMDCANRLPDTLSGGQQQRVAVARALANDPGLILADEPTAALDSARGLQVMELLSKVARERGAGVIVVTHDHRALHVFDRVLQMEDGRLWPAEQTSSTSEYAGQVIKGESDDYLLNVRVSNSCCSREPALAGIGTENSSQLPVEATFPQGQPRNSEPLLAPGEWPAQDGLACARARHEGHPASRNSRVSTISAKDCPSWPSSPILGVNPVRAHRLPPRECRVPHPWRGEALWRGSRHPAIGQGQLGALGSSRCAGLPSQLSGRAWSLPLAASTDDRHELACHRTE